MKPWIKGWSEQWRERVNALKIEISALVLVYKHPSTPWYAKVFAGVVVAYAFSPIDLVPDFIPILGYLDDLVLVPIGIFLALKMIPTEVIEECRIQALSGVENEKRGSGLAAGIIVIIWLSIGFLCVLWLVNVYRNQ